MNLVLSVTAAVLVAVSGAAAVALGGKGLCGGSCDATSAPSTVASTPMAAAPAAVSPEAPSLAKASAAATYEVDPVHSSVHFMIRHAGIANFYGRFNDFSGTLTLDPENPDSSSLSFTVKTESVDTNNTGRDNHLRNPDFFNARQFPDATFTSTSFTAGDEEGMWTVEGDLTLHGETKPVTVQFNWMGTGEMRGNTIGAFEAKMEIKRSDFGITTYMADDGGDDGPLGNTVALLISVEAGRQ